MAFVRLDDAFPEHPKVLAAGGDAAWLYICALSYSNRLLTDGFIPFAVLNRLSDRKSPTRLADRLVAVHLWDGAEDGWSIHDFLAYQKGRKEIEEERLSARDRMATHRARSAELRANEDRTEELFGQFWSCYPRKISKPTARQAFQRALTKTSIEDLAEGLGHWCEHWRLRGEEQFTPYPATWLNQERWNDRPPLTVAPKQRTRADIESLRPKQPNNNGDPNVIETTGRTG